MARLINDAEFGEVFELETLLEKLNKIPYKEDLLSRIWNWDVIPSWTDDVRINSKAGVLDVIPSVDRDGVARIRHTEKRQGFAIAIPAYAERFGILNRTLMKVAAGMDGDEALESVEEYVDRELVVTNGNMDLTVEHQRARALTGDIVDSDGVHIANMYDVMGVDQIECDVDVSNGGEDLQTQLTEIVEIGEQAMGGEPVDGWVAILSAEPSSKIARNKDYKDAQNETTAVRDRQRDFRTPVNIAGLVDVHHYRRGFLPAGTAFLAPKSSDFAKMIIGPSDVREFLGRIMPRYPFVTEMKGNRGWEAEVWAFFLNYFTRPEAVIKLNILDGTEGAQG